MPKDTDRRGSLDRRRLTAGLGGIGGLAALVARLPGGRSLARAAQGTPSATAAWTPQPIPKPLPTAGGAPPTPVGAAASSAPATPGAGQASNPVEEPGSGPEPAGGTPAAGATAGPAANVTLTPDFRFDPADVTIGKGQSVRWTNVGRSPQTVTADPARATDKGHVALPQGAKPWDSGILNHGDTFGHTFDVPGDYVYFSIPREKDRMVGRVKVTG